MNDQILILRIRNFLINLFDLYRFPADIDKRYEWIKMVKKVNWSPEERDVLCSEHFEENCFFIGARGRKYLKRDAIPTVFKNTRSRRLLMRGSQQKKLVEKVVETSIPSKNDQFEYEGIFLMHHFVF